MFISFLLYLIHFTDLLLFITKYSPCQLLTYSVLVRIYKKKYILIVTSHIRHKKKKVRKRNRRIIKLIIHQHLIKINYSFIKEICF